MKRGVLVLFALHLGGRVGVSAQTETQRYMRSIMTRGGGEICAVLDASVFAHAAPSLKDLRLVASGVEIPYIVTLSEPSDPASAEATVVHSESDGTRTAFDLRMPERAYTDVILDLGQKNFVVTATVTGSDEPGSSRRTPLGSFPLFDLSGRQLSRNTVLPLQESSFRYLHVELRGASIAAGAVLGARVPPSRQAQTLYVPVGETTDVRREGSATVATLRIPAHVPVERVSVEVAPGFAGNFDRAVRVSGRADGPVETIDGHVMRVHLGTIDRQQMAFDAAMGVNLQEAATIRVAIEDGASGPLPVSAVRLEMRRRSICFAKPAGTPTLFYGDASLSAPRYGPARPPGGGDAEAAVLGPEMPDPVRVGGRRPARGWRADLVWLVVLVGFGAAGTLALHGLRRRTVRHHG